MNKNKILSICSLLFLSLVVSFVAYAQEDTEDLGELPTSARNSDFMHIDAMQNYTYSVEGDRSHRVQFTCQLRHRTPAEMWVSGREGLFVQGNLMIFQPRMREATATWRMKGRYGRILITPPTNNAIRCFESRRGDRDWGDED